MTHRTYGTLDLADEVEVEEESKWGPYKTKLLKPVETPREGFWWRVECEPHVAIRLKRTFGRIGAQFGEIRIKDSFEVCADLEWFMIRFPLRMSDAHRAWLEERADRYHRHLATFDRLLRGELEPSHFDLAIPPREYQRVAADLWIRSRGLLIADDLGIGKQQPVDSQVLTPNGWRLIGSLRPGDQVIGSNGKATEVLGVYPQGKKPNYRVSFSDGSSTEAGPDHLWTLRYRAGGRRWVDFTVTTDQLRMGATIEMKWLGSGNNKTTTRLDLSKDFLKVVPRLSSPVVFSKQEPLPIPPYTMGQLIANGSLGHGSPCLVTAQKDWSEVRRRLLEEGAPVTSERRYDGVVHATFSGYLGIIRALELDVNSAYKRIPECYMRARPDERIALLHGLMDADGSCTATRNRVGYSTTSEKLAHDVRELVECLGGTGKVGVYDPSHHEKPTEYKVNVRLPSSIHPFWLKRKLDRYNPRQRRDPRRALREITFSREVESVCIKVAASDQLYVTDHAILTHNTVTAIAGLTDPRTRPALVVTKTSLPWQWHRELARFAPELRTHILKKGTPYDIVEEMTRKKRGRRKKPKKGEQLLIEGAENEPFPDVIITSYSKLAGWAETLAPKVKTLVFDEVQSLRRSSSNKYAAAKHLSENTEFRTGLTATPIYNYGGEMFNILDILKPGSLGTWREFLDEWCVLSAQEDKARIKDPRAFGTYCREQGLMIRRTRSEVGRELPDLIRATQHVPYDAKPLDQMKGAVSELAKILLGKAEFTEKGQAARELDWKLRQATGLAKAAHVADFVRLIAESGERVVLFGWHREVYGIWMQRLRDLNPTLYTGTESAKQKEESVRKFVEGEAQILIISLRSGEGLDGLQGHTRTVVFGELDWSPGIHEQCEGRVHRDGQSESVAAYYCITDSGSDPIIADVLGMKTEQVQGVRDPDADLISNLQSDDDRIKRLARSYLEAQGFDPSTLDDSS